jgi:hypothetical protein
VPSNHCPYLDALVLFLNIMGKQGSAKKGKAKDDGEEKQAKVFYCRVLFSSNELWASSRERAL